MLNNKKIHVNIYTYIFIHIHTYIHTYTFKYTWHTHAHTNIYDIHTYTCRLHEEMHNNKKMLVMNIYTFIFINIHTYIHKHSNIHDIHIHADCTRRCTTTRRCL